MANGGTESREKSRGRGARYRACVVDAQLTIVNAVDGRPSEVAFWGASERECVRRVVQKVLEVGGHGRLVVHPAMTLQPATLRVLKLLNNHALLTVGPLVDEDGPLAAMRQVLELGPDVLAVFGPDLRVRYISRNPYGAPDQLLGLHLDALVNEQSLRLAESSLVAVLETGGPATFDVLSPDGEVTYRCRAVGTSATPGPLEGVLVAASDVTDELRAAEDRHALEAQLQQAQKMESIGQLAGGVAHDFNNLLTVARVHLSFVRDAVADALNPAADLEVIGEAINRAADLTRTLLDVAREQPLRRIDLDAGDLVRRSHRMMARVMPAGVRIDVAVAPEPLWLHADPSQLDQAMLNLCVNAQHALGREGTLRLAARGDGDDVLIEVEDDGIGMDGVTLAHAMDPFFTTKEADSGTGLGLAMTRTLVTGNAGTITLSSEAGVGTKVTLRFSRVIPAAHEAAAVAASAAPAGRRGRLLLAEDEPMVRRATRRILERAGYEVIAAADGDEALALFEEHADSLDGAVCDVVMPGRGGRELWEAVQAARPGFKMLFCSGYSADGLPASFVAEHGITLLPKPYTREQMLGALDALGLGLGDTGSAADHA